MELSIFSAATALIAAAALTWLVLRFFFGTQKATAGAMDASGERQSATITVKGGYSPAVISMRTGTPITLTFDRQETGECTSHVVFADLGLDAMLPGNATTDVELPALPAGEYPFACGMNMVHGLLRVEGEESKDGADKDGLRPRADGSAEAEGVSPSDLRVGAPVVDAAEAERREAAERANEIKALTKLVIVGAVLTLPVFAVTMLHMANPALVPHWMVNPWLQAILITPVMFYCGRPIHTVGFPALAHRSPDMNSLVSLGTSAAYLYSLVTCIAPWVFPAGSREPYSHRSAWSSPWCWSAACWRPRACAWRSCRSPTGETICAISASWDARGYSSAYRQATWTRWSTITRPTKGCAATTPTPQEDKPDSGPTMRPRSTRAS